MRLTVLFLLTTLTLGAQFNPASFDLFVEQQLTAFDVPGLSVGIIRNGEIIHQRGYGVANSAGDKIGAETQLAIGSVSKSFTALGILLLVNDEKLALDAPVRRYLPEFRLRDAYASEHLTVRDLLRHNSGLPRHDLTWYAHDVDRTSFLERLAELEPTARLGERFQYQNLMYLVAGLLIERVSGESWEAFTHRRIMQPLAMNRSNFSVLDMARDADYAQPYAEGDWTELRNVDVIGPAGGINSTTADLLRYVEFLLGDGRVGEQRLVPKRLLDQLFTPQQLVDPSMAAQLLRDDERAPVAYGLGWFIGHHRGRLTWEHGGNIDGYTALVVLVPNTDIGLVILSNANGTSLPYVLRNRLLDELLDLDVKDWTEQALAAKSNADNNRPTPDRPIPDTQPALPLSAYAGTYYNGGYGELTVTAGADSLYLDYGYFKRAPFAHFHYNVFADTSAETFKLHFRQDVYGQIEGVEIQLEPALPPVRFARVLSKSEQDREALYTGEYEMMGMQLSVYRKDGQLTLVVPGQPEYPLTQKAPGEYSFAPGFGVIFAREGDQPASSLELIQPHGNFTARRVDAQRNAREEARATAIKPREAARYVGRYRLENESEVRVTYTDRLTLKVTGQPTFTLLPTDRADRFTLMGLTGFAVRFQRKGKTVTGLELRQPNGNFQAERVE